MTSARALTIGSLTVFALVGVACGGSDGTDPFLGGSDAGKSGGGDAASDASSDDATAPDAASACPTAEQCAGSEPVPCSTPGAQCEVSGYVGVDCVTDRTGRAVWLCAMGGAR